MAHLDYSNDGITLARLNRNDIDDGKFIVPSDVTTIGHGVFALSRLRELTIPDNVKFICAEAFWHCYDLTKIKMSNNVISLGVGAFRDCQSLCVITLSKNLTSISNHTFWSCYSLKEITIPDGVRIIGDAGFGSCTKLRTVTIPNSVNSIGYKAFHDCSALRTITLSKGLTYIGTNAFSECPNLKNIIINSDNPADIERITALLPDDLKEKVVPAETLSYMHKVQAKALMRITNASATSFGRFFSKKNFVEKDGVSSQLPLLPYDLVSLVNQFVETNSYKRAKQAIQEVAFPDKSEKGFSDYKLEIFGIVDKFIESAEKQLKPDKAAKLHSCRIL